MHLRSGGYLLNISFIKTIKIRVAFDFSKSHTDYFYDIQISENGL